MTLYYDGVPYVDPAPGYKPPARAATTGALPASTYAAGVLTANAVGALPAQDGVALALGDRLLVKNQATGSQNGLYTVTAFGSGAAAWQLTRALDSDTSADFTSGELVVVQEGATLADTIFELATNAPIVLDTTALTFARSTTAPGGPAGGDLAGTYPNPTLAASIATGVTWTTAPAVAVTDGVTAAPTTVLTLKHAAGVSAANIAARVVFQTTNGAGVARDAAYADGVLTTATNTLEDSAFDVWTRTGGAVLARALRVQGSGGMSLGTAATFDQGASTILVGADGFGTYGLFFRWTNATNYPLATLSGSTVILGNPSFPTQIRSSGDVYVVRAGIVVLGLLANGVVQAGNSDGTTTSLTDATFRATDVGATADLMAPNAVARAGVSRGAALANYVSLQASIPTGAGTGAQTLGESFRAYGQYAARQAGFVRHRTTTSSSRALLVTEDLVACNSTGGAIAPTLPSAGGVPAGWEIQLTDEANSANAITVTRAGADTINSAGAFGAATKVVPQGGTLTLYSDGVSKWFAR